ncbi:protein tyrosine phosphatase receptor type C-associated protein [Macaca nemestrina]|nr:protein tyrosine phosphatase receptor type C-associated protein [Macaca nemestrina]XP_050612730.1 protein tyrosine phosphatase receptor type C-associated protein [Macaca thibetana thibetana]
MQGCIQLQVGAASPLEDRPCSPASSRKAGEGLVWTRGPAAGRGRWGMWAGSGSPGHPSLQTSTELTSRSTQPELEVGARRGGACGPMALPCTLGLGMLLALPGALGSGGSAEDSVGSSSVTVVLLLLLLLLLVTGLALAWRRLSRDSGGYYHPARLGAALWGRTRRLLWASPPGRWLQARAELGSPDNDLERQEDEQDADYDHVTDGGLQADPGEGEQLCGEASSPEQVPVRAEEARDSDTEGDLVLGSPGPASAGGSAEALLSDLHAFAGSAAWDDSARAAGGQGLHVTAL